MAEWLAFRAGCLDSGTQWFPRSCPANVFAFDNVSQHGLNTGTLTNLADGQLVNAAWISEDAPLGQGGCAQFNGLDSPIRVPNDGQLSVTRNARADTGLCRLKAP